MALLRHLALPSTACALWLFLAGIAGASPKSLDPGAIRPRTIPAKPVRSEVFPGYDPVHIEIKFRDDLEPYLDTSRIPRERRGGLQSVQAQRVLRDLQSAAAAWSKAVTLDPSRVDALRLRAERSLGRAIADVNDYFILTLPPGADAGRWMDDLNALPEVELATPLPLPAPPALAGDFTPLQGYLTPATAGTDASYAWTLPGGTGTGVTICAVESGWNPNHQDLPPVSLFLPDGATPTPPDPEGDHGTAVLGAMGSLPNGWGTTGAAYGASFALAPVFMNGFYQLPQALLESVSRLEAGDVIVIAQQVTGPQGVGLAPVEWNQASYFAILMAVGNGIHVVEAAGNGSMNLDDAIFRTGHAPFLPENDSGAIIVGAGASPPLGSGPVDRSKLSFSNYGSRVNLQGWGHNVTTTGYGDLYSAEGKNLYFTRFFTGTSSASPIVASAVASIEGIVEAETGTPAHPALVRTLLERTGSPQQSGSFPVDRYHIGPRPDLRAAMQQRGTPIVATPGVIQAREEAPLGFTVHAGDLDGDPIQTLTAFPLPAGSSFDVAPDHRSGTFAWTPARGQAGTYSIAFTASNTTEGTATTQITVESIERPPAIVAPGGFVLESHEVRVTASASDPNGDPIVSFEVSGLPAGATFTKDPTGASGLFVWTPDFTQAGVHTVTFRATSIPTAPPGSAPVTTTADMIWTVLDLDRQPVVSAPGVVDGTEGIPVQFIVAASDPDGQPIQSLTALGLPPGSTYQESSDHASGTFHWTPSFTQAGSYDVEFLASNALAVGTVTNIRIANVDRAPVITAPSLVPGTEGVAIEFEALAEDPDGDPILEFEVFGLPPGARFLVDPVPSSARFEWTPEFGQAGTYAMMLSASSADRASPVSGALRTSTATVEIVVARGNRSPVADAGGPYFGLALAPVMLDGTASFDPDGDPLAYRWDFGDGTTGSGSQPAHAFPPGVFTVTLTVTDGTGSDTAQTSATIHPVLPARTYLFGGGGVLRLVSGKPEACFQIEPAEAFFEIRSIDLSTVALSSTGTGSVESIPAIADKSAAGADRDRNGVQEITACFAKDDLRRLFDTLGGGRSTVMVTFRGQLAGGGEFRSHLALEVFQSNTLEASLAPNPVQGQATLSFRTTTAGTAKVSVYDVSGRLLGVALEASSIPAGYHDVAIGRVTLGRTLPVGVYFYRIVTRTDETTGRFSVVR